MNERRIVEGNVLKEPSNSRLEVVDLLACVSILKNRESLGRFVLDCVIGPENREPPDVDLFSGANKEVVAFGFPKIPPLLG